MACHHLLTQITGKLLGSKALMLQHLVVITLGTLIILLPPTAKGGHIMGKDSGYTTVRIVLESGKCLTIDLGHSLNLEGKNLDVIRQLLELGKLTGGGGSL